MKSFNNKERNKSPEKTDHLFRVPPAPLSNFIAAIWASSAKESLKEIRVIPDGCGILLFNFSKPVLINTENNHYQLTKTLFSGISSRYHDLTCTENHEQAGVIFKPFGAFQLMDIPMSAFYNAGIETDLIAKNKFSEIFEKMQTAAAPAGRLLLLEKWLLLHLSNKTLAPGINYLTSLLQNDDEITAGQLAIKAGFSQQHTARLFNKYIGATPKTMQRIFRFQNALTLMNHGTDKSLTDICYSANYFDQAHFIHECRSLTGYTPKELPLKLFPEQKRIALL